LHEAGCRQCDSVWDASAGIVQPRKPSKAGERSGKGDRTKAEKDERKDSAEKGGRKTIVEDCGPPEPCRGCGRQLRVPAAEPTEREHAERNQENRQAARYIEENTNSTESRFS
jgi:hypothetical protein